MGWVDRLAGHQIATVFAFLGLVAVGVLDSLTGSDVSFGVFYVFGVIAVTVVAGPRLGVAASLFSALLWGAADVLTHRSGLAVVVDVWNVLTRFGVHVIVVLLLSALLDTLRRARESEAASRSFLATAAHQLRTPIAAVGASVDALLAEGASPAQERLLANLGAESGRLGRLVGSLLRTARLDQGEPLSPRPVDVRELGRAEIDRVRQLSVADCRFTVTTPVPDVILLDPEATAESLSNLLDNARRHASSRIELRLAATREDIVFEVTDDGPGLPLGTEEQAFDRFVTLDGRGGTGLGLAIARELAQRQRGTLTYEHRAFVLTLPLEPAPGRATRLSREG